MDWLDLLAVQRTLKSLLQHHSSKASILRHSAFFEVQLSHPYMTTGKTIALTRRTFVAKVMSLLLNMRFLPPIIFNPDLFKKVGDIKGTFHARMGMIKDRNDKDLIEQKRLRRGGKNTQKNYTKKGLKAWIITMVWSLT